MSTHEKWACKTSKHSTKGIDTRHSKAPHTFHRNKTNTPTPSILIQSNKLVTRVHLASVYCTEWNRSLSRLQFARAIPHSPYRIRVSILRKHPLISCFYTAHCRVLSLLAGRLSNAILVVLAKCHSLYFYFLIIFHAYPCHSDRLVKLQLKIAIFSFKTTVKVTGRDIYILKTWYLRLSSFSQAVKYKYSVMKNMS